MNHCILFSITSNLRSRPSGVHRIAHHLRTQGWNAEVIDFFYGWTLEELKELVRSRVTKNTRFFGFSWLFFRNEIKNTINPFCEWVKINYPDIIFISGGQTEQISNDIIHYHIAGYGEYALNTLLSYLFSNGKKPRFSFQTRSKTKLINAIHSYPAFPMQDPMIKYESRDFIVPGEWGRIEFSRGCKFSCKYCNFPVLGVKGDYTRTAESAREQLLHAYDNWGIEDYLVSDETFNDYTEKITKFANVVETLPWKPYFAGFIRGDLLVSRPADRHELLRMGFFSHYYGIETFNQKSAQFVGKGMKVEKIQSGLIDVKNFFKSNTPKNYYAGSMAFISGLPYETLESLESTHQWIRSNWLDQIVIASPLEINKNFTFRYSDIDENFSSYGYREMKINDIELDITKINDFYGNGGHVIWENDNMNFIQALDWAEKIRSLKIIAGHDYQRLSMGDICNILCDENGDPLPRDKKLSVTRGNSRNHWNLFLEKYKKKKLSI